jgi:HrpA-like RNA helicase
MSNNTLPVANFRDQILSSVAATHVVTIVVAETGAGKSTQVPQYLLEAGYDIVVTQPRRLAARTVAERVAEEFGCELGDVVGFRTAQERRDSQTTRCLFVTDGLALVRELMGAGSHSVLVLDEVHEWNLNIETLVAWAKAQVAKNASFKLVLMSATLEAEALSRFFDGAPVINVPGRLFPVTTRTPAAKLVDDVVALVGEGRNVLVFQPGKAEISELVDMLERMQINAEILPLHGELTGAEQKKCFAHYPRPKVVVSTNVAQTSVTIDDIDAVIDSGMERRIELVNGVEGLYLRAISKADSKQRAGRAGRTKPGVYIDHCPSADRRDFPVAEIERVRLDQTVLRLAIAGFDMEGLQFFHQPEVEKIHAAKESLKKLGCMDASGHVSAIGRAVSRLPVSVQFGRMIVEAERLGVVGDIITAAAILESGELNTRKDKDGYPSEEWRHLTGGERESDVIAQMYLYDAAGKMAPSERFDRGVHPKAYQRAKDLRKQIESALESRGVDVTSSGKRENILLAICAGMVDHLYRNSWGRLENGESRERAKESVVALGQWAVGLPFDLQITTRRGPMTLKLVRMLTSVTPEMLEQVAPQLVERKTGLNCRFDTTHNEVVSTTEVRFNGVKISEEVVADHDHPEATRIVIEQLYSTFRYPALPSVEIAEDAEVPNVTEVIVGHHPKTGESLTAYGAYQKDSWYNRLVGKWVRDRREANTLHAQTVEQVAAVLARKRDEAQKQAEATTKREAEVRAKAERIARIRPGFEALNRRRETLGMNVIELREESYVQSYCSYEFSDEALNRFTSETDAHEAKVREEAATKDFLSQEELPEWLVGCFRGSKELAMFIRNVDALDPKKLDAHETCGVGRARARAHIIQASGGNEEFFQGADPNDVKYWIWERVMSGANHHFNDSRQKTKEVTPLVTSVQHAPATMQEKLAALAGKFAR